MTNFNFYRLKLVKEQEVTYKTISSSHDAGSFLSKLIGDEAEEHFVVIGLNSHGEVISGFRVSHGDIKSSIVDTGSVMKRLLLSNATCFICSHNHPSATISTLSFSSEDIAVTKRLKKAGSLLGVKLLDHIVVASDGSHISAKSEGLF